MTRTLEQGPKRTVVLEEGPEPRVVKRFHAPGLLGRLADRRRAAREHARLGALAARGLPVPEVLSLERSNGRWQVVTRWIEGALPLARLLEGREPWPTAPERLARALGALLGRAHAAGVRHGDLHAGNVVIDAAGQPWIVDPLHVRLGRVGAAAAREDLVRAAAMLRERTSPRFRARALCAWRRAAPADLRAAYARASPELALERDARRERARALLTNEDRWTRPSGLLEAVAQEDGLVWLVRRGRPTHGPGAPAFAGLRPAARRRAFARLGRLHEHGLGVPAPARIARDGGARAELDGLEGLAPLGTRAAAFAPRERRRAARALGALLGALRDRGFDPAAPGPADVLAGAGGELLFAPGIEPRRAAGPGAGRAGAGLGELCAGAARRERALFVAGFRGALRGCRAERAAWTEELRGR